MAIGREEKIESVSIQALKSDSASYDFKIEGVHHRKDCGRGADLSLWMEKNDYVSNKNCAGARRAPAQDFAMSVAGYLPGPIRNR